MIIVNGRPFNIANLSNEYSEDSIERQLLKTMSETTERFQYDNLNMLKFELQLRKEIIDSALALNDSDFSFSGFVDSKCNTTYWYRTENGGFMLKETASPADAINDIFTNGKEYSTECATAIVLVYYKALINVLGNDLFNKQFPRIFLLGWISKPIAQYIYSKDHISELLLGDGTYFSNPDFDPEKPEWQGENVIVLPDSMYYGHGIGIATADDMIRTLNKFRKSGATRSAYLTNTVNRLDVDLLGNVYYTGRPQTTLVWEAFPPPITSA